MGGPLNYRRILTEPTEDTRRVVAMTEPPGTPDERGVYRVGQWRGKRTASGPVLWQTEEVWGQEIEPLESWGREGVDWHVTRRDVAVDVEAEAGEGPPEPWWREYFGGLRGRFRKMAQPATADLLTYDMCSGTGASIHTQTGDSEYFGSRRSPAMFRIYLKYTRPGSDRKVRQCHRDAWTRAGWEGGAVYRVEAVLSPPTEMGAGVTARELFADAAARVRLLKHPPERRKCDVPTADRWEALAHPLKLARPMDTAPDEAAARLLRALDKLAKEHGDNALRLGLLLRGATSVQDRREAAERLAAMTAEPDKPKASSKTRTK